MTLTPLQLAVYDHVRDQISEVGIAPTYPELMDRFGIVSKGQLAGIIDAIVREGRLVRTAAKMRNLALPSTSAVVDLTHVATGALQAELVRRGAPLRRPRRITEFAATKPCPSPYCQERVSRGQLYCRTHWRALPSGLRSELLETYRGGQQTPYADAWRRSQEYLEHRS